MIIPFFIPHSGCPHQCVFCNQKKITGKASPPDPASIPATIETYLNTSSPSSKTKVGIPGLTLNPAPFRNSLDSRDCGNDERGKTDVQVAFYGGSFTALPIEQQRPYLDAVEPFISSGRIDSIRLSTRPDCITGEVLSFLKDHHVKTIELGAQSMDDRVLALSGRGHTAADTVKAVELLREHEFSVGLQLMPGLPGDSADTFLDTVTEVITLKPDFVRLYPALIIKGTPLEGLYKAGKYSPLSLDEAVTQCRAAMARFGQAGIEIIRVGLQPTEELEKTGTVVAGPYHPAFRQLVESSVLLDAMRAALRRNGDARTSVTLHVNSSDLSSAIGRKRCNVALLKGEFGLGSLAIVPDDLTPRGSVWIEQSPSGTAGNLI